MKKIVLLFSLPLFFACSGGSEQKTSTQDSLTAKTVQTDSAIEQKDAVIDSSKTEIDSLQNEIDNLLQDI